MEVYVFGLGHIGLPMAASIALQGYHVNGIDINQNHIQYILQGTVNIEEYYQDIHLSQVVKDLIREEALTVSSVYKRTSSDPSIFVITVGIANGENNTLDVSPIFSALQTIFSNIVEGDLILFRTTLIPGTCDNIIKPMIKGLKKAIYFAFCPETLIEGRAFEELESNTMILAGMDEASFLAAEKFLSSLTNAPIVKASSMKLAELTKVVQNIDRDVNIALVNELSQVTSELQVDIYELQKLVNTHPRVKLLNPGPGVGGYCLPNAFPYLKSAIGDSGECPLTLIKTARELNDKQPERVVKIIRKALNESGLKLDNATVAILGLAMKDFTADIRFSPALSIVNLLLNERANVKAFDPLVPSIYPFQVDSFEECLREADCLVITARQKGVDFQRDELLSLMKHPIIVDTRNAFPNLSEFIIHRI